MWLIKIFCAYILLLFILKILDWISEARSNEKMEEEKREQLLEKTKEENRIRIELEERRTESSQQRKKREIREKLKQEEEYLLECERHNVCPECKGIGVDAYCYTCEREEGYLHKAIWFMPDDREKHEDEVYCEKCQKQGRNPHKLYELPCSNCNGSGKYTNYFE